MGDQFKSTITLSAAEAVERAVAGLTEYSSWLDPKEKAGVYAALASGGTFALGTVVCEGCKCPAEAAGYNGVSTLGIAIDGAFEVTTGISIRLVVTV